MSAAFDRSIGSHESQFSQLQAADNLVRCSSTNVAQTLDVVVVGSIDHIDIDYFIILTFFEEGDGHSRESK